MRSYSLRRATILTVLALGLIVSARFIGASSSSAQTLEEVLDSEAMHEFERTRKRTATRLLPKSNYLSNYNSLWTVKTPGFTLLDWIGAKLPGYKYQQPYGLVQDDHAIGSAGLIDKQGTRVNITILVPKPQYITMAEYKTLIAFNRLRPPFLDVVADQTLPIQNREAKFYRARNGSCSLLFEIEKHSLINLHTEKCSDAPIMMQVAKALNIERLNQKLAS